MATYDVLGICISMTICTIKVYMSSCISAWASRCCSIWLGNAKASRSGTATVQSRFLFVYLIINIKYHDTKFLFKMDL